MAVKEKAKAVASKVNPVNSTNKRWGLAVAAAPFVGPAVIALLKAVAPDSIGPLDAILDALLNAAHGGE